ncbi:CHAT domain-containing protein [uncultured Thiodictyon sp.]|uniref:CHAT domain-containing protein n=1 Tax=uncultured Thiodictyon sp. TaxID=1846217 RepID=UPI0025F3D7B4|nr:CHAT domain-containing protein [uncultured Thiodictyon sp.]
MTHSEGPDSRTIRLPRSGDSDIARFRLTPKSIDAAQAQRQIQITLWHRETFVGQVSRDLTVYADRPPVAPEKPRESEAVPSQIESSSSPAAIAAVAPQPLLSKSAPGLARPEPKPTHQSAPAPIGIIDKEAPDLTVFLNYPAPGTGGEGTVTIHSHYQQSVTAALPAADGLEEWLRALDLGATKDATRRPVQWSDGKQGQDQDPRRAIDRMQSLGEDAYRRFAPAVFQNAYWDLRERLGGRFDSIQIITNQPLVPWELMRPSRKDRTDDFLGIAFRIGRWHLNRTAGVLRSPDQQQVLRDLIAIAPDYAGVQGLPAVSDELRGLARFTGYRRLDARYESLRDLGQDPQRPRGIIHFAGHGEAAADAPASQYHIKLEDGDLDPLAWHALFKQSSAHPFVFLNACEIGQARPVGFFVEGWAPAVLETGASGFVGGLWPLPDRSAAAFAIRFYAELVGHLERNGEASVAEALRQTRTHFRETGDPTYLAYVFYGDPELRFQAGRPVENDARTKP